jgi:hypothetical protein
MTKIVIAADCGNSRRKVFLKDFIVAFVKGDAEFIQSQIPDEILWEIAGARSIEGKENYSKHFSRHKLWKASELRIETVITHGPEASVSGRVITSDNSAYSFREVYRFRGAAGKTIRSMPSFIYKEKK